MEIAPLIIAGLMTIIFAQIVYLIARRSAGKLKLRAARDAKPKVEKPFTPDRVVPGAAALKAFTFPHKKVSRRSHAAMVNAIRAGAAAKTNARSAQTGRYRTVKTDQEPVVIVTEEGATFSAFVKR